MTRAGLTTLEYRVAGRRSAARIRVGTLLCARPAGNGALEVGVVVRMTARSLVVARLHGTTPLELMQHVVEKSSLRKQNTWGGPKWRPIGVAVWCDEPMTEKPASMDANTCLADIADVMTRPNWCAWAVFYSCDGAPASSRRDSGG